MLRGWLDSIGPTTPAALAARLSLPLDAIESALAQLESEGTILRGRFASQEIEYCHRRILARIHRMTLGRLRREIEPVTSAQFMRFLCAGSTSPRARNCTGPMACCKSCGSWKVARYRPPRGSRRCCRAAWRITIPNCSINFACRVK